MGKYERERREQEQLKKKVLQADHEDTDDQRNHFEREKEADCTTE